MTDDERDAKWAHAIHCDTCHGPAQGLSDMEIDLAHLAYWLYMRLPDWLAFGRFGFLILPYVGTWAYACTCRDKNRAVLTARWTENPHAG